MSEHDPEQPGTDDTTAHGATSAVPQPVFDDPTAPVEEPLAPPSPYPTAPPAPNAQQPYPPVPPPPGAQQGYPPVPPAPGAQQPYPSEPAVSGTGAAGDPTNAYGQPYAQPPVAGGAPALPPATPPYGQPAYGYPGMAPAYAQPAPTNTSAIVLLVLSILGLFACCGVLLIPSGILGGMALSKQATDPERSRQLTKYGWIAFGAGLALTILALVGFFIAVGVTGARTGTSTGTYG